MNQQQETNSKAVQKQAQSSNGLIVQQAFLIHATTFPGLAVAMTNLHESTFKNKNLKMVLVDGGLTVSGDSEDKKSTLRFFIPSTNIKVVALA